MTAVEILLLVIGVVFFVASFFITEKLTPGELNKIGDLSNDEIQKVMERELQKASQEIEGKVEERVEEALAKSERSMEKESNEKIMAIGEFSDTVIENMNKTHNEIMFLYSMLNDKHTELTQFSSKLQELARDLEKKDEEITSHTIQLKQMDVLIEENNQVLKENVIPKEELQMMDEVVGDDTDEWLDEKEEFNHNETILALHKEGKSSIEIARELALGLGEVQLVIGLYEGNRR